MPTLDEKLDIFEKQGPYTFKRALQLAKLCARSKEWQLGDTLTECIDKFSPVELEKILNPEKYCSPTEYEQWLRGTEGYTFENYTGTFTNEQLEVVANSDLNGYEQKIDFGALPYDVKLTILKIQNQSLQKKK